MPVKARFRLRAGAALLCGVTGVAPAHGAECDGNADVPPTVAIDAELAPPPGSAAGMVVHTLTRPLPRLAGCEADARASVQVLGVGDVGARGLYPTGIDGLGVRLFVQEQALYAGAAVVVEQASWLRMEFVRTATKAVAGRVDAARLPGLLLTPEAGGPAQRLDWIGTVALREATCRIADVRVDMGVVSLDALRGDRTPPARPFSVELLDCPVGAQAMRFRLDAGTRMPGMASSVAALDGHASARHVGVQLRDTSGTPLAFDTDHALPREAGQATTGIRIPMQAVYVAAPGQLPEPGSASTTVHITVVYD